MLSTPSPLRACLSLFCSCTLVLHASSSISCITGSSLHCAIQHALTSLGKISSLANYTSVQFSRLDSLGLFNPPSCLTRTLTFLFHDVSLFGLHLSSRAQQHGHSECRADTTYSCLEANHSKVSRSSYGVFISCTAEWCGTGNQHSQRPNNEWSERSKCPEWQAEKHVQKLQGGKQRRR